MYLNKWTLNDLNSFKVYWTLTWDVFKYNTNEVIFASMGDTLDTGIMIPSECARILVVDSTESKGSNTVTILPKASTAGDYDVVEVQQLWRW